MVLSEPGTRDYVNIPKQTNEITTTPMRFRTNPSFAMVLMLKRPVLNMMVLGVVATGSMNAQLALMAAGTINRAGSS